MTTTPEPEYIGASEVCQILRIDRSTLSRWVKDGRLTPSMKMPGQTGAYLFDRRSILDRASA